MRKKGLGAICETDIQKAHCVLTFYIHLNSRVVFIESLHLLHSYIALLVGGVADEQISTLYSIDVQMGNSGTIFIRYNTLYRCSRGPLCFDV